MTEFDKVIHPGGVGKVTASIHTTNLKGDITKSVTVTTNDPGNSHVVLQLKAKVRVPVDVTPDVVTMDGKAGELKPAEVTISAMEGDAFDIVSADFNDTHFKATIVPATEGEAGKPAPKAPKPKAGTVASGSKSYKLTISPTADLPVARTTASLTLKTTHPKAPELTIRIYANVRGEIDVLPERITLRLGASAPDAAKVQHVTIRKNSTEGAPLKVTSVTSSVPEIKTTLKTTTEGQEYDLEIKYDGPMPTKVLNEKVTVKTNNPKQPSLEIVVYAMLDPQLPQPAAAGGIKVVPGPVPAKPAPPPASPKPAKPGH